MLVVTKRRVDTLNRIFPPTTSIFDSPPFHVNGNCFERSGGTSIDDDLMIYERSHVRRFFFIRPNNLRLPLEDSDWMGTFSLTFRGAKISEERKKEVVFVCVRDTYSTVLFIEQQNI